MAQNGIKTYKTLKIFFKSCQMHKKCLFFWFCVQKYKLCAFLKKIAQTCVSTSSTFRSSEAWSDRPGTCCLICQTGSDIRPRGEELSSDRLTQLGIVHSTLSPTKFMRPSVAGAVLQTSCSLVISLGNALPLKPLNHSHS